MGMAPAPRLNVSVEMGLRRSDGAVLVDGPA
jgi:hypothetical protein